MILAKYYKVSFDLLKEDKTAANLKLDLKNKGKFHVDFCIQICELLDFKVFTNKQKLSNHFNVVIQSEVAAVNFKFKQRRIL